MSRELIEQREKLIINFIIEDRYRICRHVLFCLVFFSIIFFNSIPSDQSENYRYFMMVVVYIVFLAMVYVNIYVLVPKYFFKTRYFLYLFYLILTVFIGINLLAQSIKLYQHFFDNSIHVYTNKIEVRGIYSAIVIVVPMIMVTTTIKLLQKWKKDSLQISELQTLTLNMELNELKNQINPHFLFNMLNNVKALIRKNPETATLVIMKLSEFLRYQLYENNEEKTPLNSEITFLTNFLELEKIRQENLIIEIENLSNQKQLNSIFIPPNLFTTFVENAVKNSINISNEAACIKISIEIKNKKLHFTCKNSVDPNYKNPQKNYNGLGLPNIKRRLDLLYKNDYSLDIKSTKNEYTINLILPI